MLLISTTKGACVVIRRNYHDRAMLARVEETLGWSFRDVELISQDDSPFWIGGEERVPIPENKYLPPHRLEILEYRAYAFVDELVTVSGGWRQKCGLTFYHEFASLYYRTLRAYDVISGAGQRVYVVDESFVAQLRSVMARTSELHIRDLQLEFDTEHNLFAASWKTSRRIVAPVRRAAGWLVAQGLSVFAWPRRLARAARRRTARFSRHLGHAKNALAPKLHAVVSKLDAAFMFCWRVPARAIRLVRRLPRAARRAVRLAKSLRSGPRLLVLLIRVIRSTRRMLREAEAFAPIAAKTFHRFAMALLVFLVIDPVLSVVRAPFYLLYFVTVSIVRLTKGLVRLIAMTPTILSAMMTAVRTALTWIVGTLILKPLLFVTWIIPRVAIGTVELLLWVLEISLRGAFNVDRAPAYSTLPTVLTYPVVGRLFSAYRRLAKFWRLLRALTRGEVRRIRIEFLAFGIVLQALGQLPPRIQNFLFRLDMFLAKRVQWKDRGTGSLLLEMLVPRLQLAGHETSAPTSPGSDGAQGKKARKRRVLVTANDSGTRVNLDPARAVLRQFRQHEVEAIVLTESPVIAKELRAEKLAEVILDAEYRLISIGKPRPPALPLYRHLEAHRDLCLILNAALSYHWFYFVHRHRLLNYILKELNFQMGVTDVLSVNETLPVSVAAGLWAREAGVPWVGHFPILLGKRPDCHFFPADYHLAYGSQLRDHMIESGVAEEVIEVVGSFTFDKHRGRNRAADRLSVDARFKRARNKKLVTVASEGFLDPETEMIPILTAITRIPGIHIVLKLHPEDSIERFHKLAEDIGVRRRIDIVKAFNLSELLSASDLLICVMSNVAIEAAVLGTPTLMCDFAGKAKVINFVEQGLCLGCTDPTKVPDMVSDILFDPKLRAEAHARMNQGIRRFNGPNDGRSAERIVDFVLSLSPSGRAMRGADQTRKEPVPVPQSDAIRIMVR